MSLLRTKKNRGVLSIEFSVLILVMIIVSLLFFSLFLIVKADRDIYSAVDDATKSMRAHIYVSSLAKRDVYAFNLIGLGEQSLKKIGIVSSNDHYTVNINKRSLEAGIKTRTMKKLKLKRANSLINDNININVALKGNSIVVSSDSSVKAPIINEIYGEVKLSHKHVIAAKGIEKLLSSNNDYSNFVENSKIAITLNGKKNTQVYHTKRCFAMMVSNNETTDFYNKSDYYSKVTSNADIFVGGITYHICPFCKGR